MRTGSGSGSCSTVQAAAALTSEALSVVKQGVILAKRRGHAQVTPLHVASTMLSSPTGLLTTACLHQSHYSHPLQCKALQLCFNVALNRLPAAAASTSPPSISNALVAAFKRAQAQQRRGTSIDNQQQPLLALKIDLQHLIISILDDPSVSRVMREAGFSSTQVKTKLQQTPIISNIIHHNNNNITKDDDDDNDDHNRVVSEDDIAAVINDLSDEKKRRRRSVVVVGECLGRVESVVEAAIGRIEKRDELLPECLGEVKFINLSISSFRNRSRVEVDAKVMELNNLIRIQKRVILYVGDIKWTVDYMQNYSTNQTLRPYNNNNNYYYYCPVEHMVMELGKLVYGNYNHHKAGGVWIMGIATFQTYIRCKSGNPSLQTLLAIHPLTIPAGSLTLSLMAHSEIESQIQNNSEEKILNNSTESTTTSSTPLPAWLQQYKNEQKLAIGENIDQKCVAVTDLYKKWNSICNSIHKNSNNNNMISSEKSLSFSCNILPNYASSASGFSYDHDHNHNHNHNQFNFLQYAHKEKLKDHQDFYEGNVEPKQLMILNNNDDDDGLTASSGSSGSDVVMEGEYVSRFKELNSENLKRLCSALEKKVPWQKDVMADIASAVLQCRSGMMKRKGNMGHSDFKEETWLLFQGNDEGAKEKVGRELGRVIFGTAAEESNLVCIRMSSSFSSSSTTTRRRAELDNCRNYKRKRDEQIRWSYMIERFAEAVSINPHRVFLIEDVEQSDYSSQMGFKTAIQIGTVTNSNGHQVSLADAIVILTSAQTFTSRSSSSSSQQHEETGGSNLGLDLNISVHHHVGLLDLVDRRIDFQIQQL